MHTRPRRMTTAMPVASALADAAAQVLDPSHVNHDVEVPQAFLDAWTPVAT